MSSKPLQKLSGAEALDEYFTALLDEEWELADEPSIDKVSLASVTSTATDSLSGQKQEIAPILERKVKVDYEVSYTQSERSEYEVPDLEDVQKLLDKMETTDLAAEPEIVTLIEQNTATINEEHSVVVPLQAIEPEIDEVQDWEIEVQDTQIFETTVEEPQVYVEQDVEVETELQTEFSPSVFDDWKSTERSVDFQVLYFDVNGIMFAVPLDELGGIHKTGEMSHLIGRPGWYLGLQTNKDNQYDVVDTAKWVMADRLKDDSHKESYQYIVMLGDSNWGLAATELKGTESLNVESVRWREQAGKRPWLAGMVKEKMCALIHVEAMITMITAGLDVKSLDS